MSGGGFCGCSDWHAAGWQDELRAAHSSGRIIERSGRHRQSGPCVAYAADQLADRTLTGRRRGMDTVGWSGDSARSVARHQLGGDNRVLFYGELSKTDRREYPSARLDHHARAIDDERDGKDDVMWQ